MTHRTNKARLSGRWQARVGMREVTGALRVFGVEGGGTARVAGMRRKKREKKEVADKSGSYIVDVRIVNKPFTRDRCGGTIKPNICSVLLFCFGLKGL